jgi:hypothetical protein
MMPQTPEADTLTLSSRVFNRNRNCLSVPGSFKFFAVVRVAHLCCFLFCGFFYFCLSSRPVLCSMFPVSLDCSFLITSSDFSKKSLKLPMGQSEAVNWRKTDNTMTKTKRKKWHTTIFNTLHRNLKIQQR